MEKRAHQDRYSIATYVIFGLLGLAIICVFYIVEGHHHPGLTPLWALLLREAGFALLIAVCLIFTIEKRTRERHDEELQEWLQLVTTNVFRAVMLRSTPERVFQEVEKSLLYRDFYRRDTAVTYTIRKFTAADGNITDAKKQRFRRCNVNFHYNVVNNNQANRTIAYPVRLALDLIRDAELDHLNKLVAVEINGVAVQITGSNCKVEANVLKFEHAIEIVRGGTAQVRCEWSQVVKDEDQEVWSSIDPTDGVTFTVNTPDGDLKVWGDSMHSESLVPIQQNDVAVTWRLDYGVFPYQGIYFRWSKQ